MPVYLLGKVKHYQDPNEKGKQFHKWAAVVTIHTSLCNFLSVSGLT